MKKNYLPLLFLLISIFSKITAQDCLPDGIEFTAQEQIDSFPINFNCTHILGNVTIRSNDITNLNGLLGIDSIGGSLTIGGTFANIQNIQLQDLTGLDSLSYIGGSLFIGGNDALGSLKGLDNFSFIGSNLSIGNNEILTDISSLSMLTAIPGDLSIGGYFYAVFPSNWFIVGNNALTNLTGLENISSVGSLSILSNPLLASIEDLVALDSIAEDLTITWNNSLTSLTGLENIISIPGMLTLGSCPLISLTELSGCSFVNSIVLYGLDSLTNLEGLENIDSIPGLLSIGKTFGAQDLGSWQVGNNSLMDLSGLQNLSHVGSLHILGNPLLSNLNELDNLTSLDGDLKVIHNETLTSLIGLGNIDHSTISDLELAGSSNLAICEVESICDYLAIPTNPASISDNASGCDNRVEVENACEAVVSVNTITSDKVQIFPNPTTGMVNVVGINGGQVEVLNSQGKVLMEKEFTLSVIDLSELPNGMYFIQIQYGNHRVTERIIKL